MESDIENVEMVSKHFSYDEMNCKCKRKDCNAIKMQSSFMIKLEKLRELMDIPLIPISAMRCVFWNGMVGGQRKSQHIYGNASDFWFQDQIEKERFIRIAENVGFLGIGTGNHLVHIDNRKKYARWSYSNR